MSSPYVIVAAVHEPDVSLEEWWKENHDSLHNFEKEYDHNDEVDWRFCEGTFKSTHSLEEFKVKTEYHSGRGEDVIEIILSGREDIQNINMTGLESILEEINHKMDPTFTLEVYYRYMGFDKPGGT